MVKNKKKIKPFKREYLGETETIWNNLNPDFATSFKVEFIFEKKQYFKIEARDLDNKAGTKWDSLGQAEFELGKVIASVESTLEVELTHEKNGKKMGVLVVKAEKANMGSSQFHLDLKIGGIQNGCSIFEKPKNFIE